MTAETAQISVRLGCVGGANGAGGQRCRDLSAASGHVGDYRSYRDRMDGGLGLMAATLRRQSSRALKGAYGT